MAVFKSTGTTKALIKAVKPYVKGGRLLDLACGCGVVGNAMDSKIYASDISQEAVDYVSRKYPNITVKWGNLFDPWKNWKFDYIIDDVSGVAEEIARVSPWFDGVACASGKDGADLVVSVLQQAPDYLRAGGLLFFPIVSLSNVRRTLEVANRIYDTRLLSRTVFPLPKEMYKHIDLLRSLKSHGIEFEEKFGMILFTTYIYKAVRNG